METFANLINQQKFKSTNYIWNLLKLNSPWSIGYVSTLIESRKFENKEEWKQYYYQSGEERLRKIEECCTEEEKTALLDFTKSSNHLSAQCKELNLAYGRTEKELKERGQYMYRKIVEEGNPYNITEDECVYMVKFRIMAETWNGIIAREHNTIKKMEEMFPDIRFEKTIGERDYNFAIDYELYEEESLLCAVQIKPLSYQKGFSKEIVKAKKTNEAKNKKYTEQTNADVLYVYSNSKGDIINKEILSDIKLRAGDKSAHL